MEHKTLKQWFDANIADESFNAEDICNHGCVAGVSGLCTYDETCAIYELYKVDIWAMLEEDCESMGHKNIMELISTFNGADHVDSDYTFQNLCVWYAVENLARQYQDEQGE